MIMCDEIIDAEEKEIIPANFHEKKVACKTQNLYILLAFLFYFI